MLANLRFHLVAIFAALPLGFAYSNPETCNGACWAHDPAVIQRASDGKYFKFNTGGGIEIATATSLEGPWTRQGFALPSGTIINAPQKTDLWAPDVTLVNGVYHMYYAVSKFGSRESTIGLATSKTMEVGSWTDLGTTGIATTQSSKYNAIDPNLVFDNDNYYLNFGSFWNDIQQVRLNADATKMDGAITQMEYDPQGSHACEGSFMFKYSGYWYLFWSHGVCCGYDTKKPAAGEEYRIMMCRSTSPTSGFVDASGKACVSGGGTRLLESHDNVYGPGGQGVFNDTSRGPVLYYHYANPTRGLGDGAYIFGWNVLKWSNGWPSV